MIARPAAFLLFLLLLPASPFLTPTTLPRPVYRAPVLWSTPQSPSTRSSPSQSPRQSPRPPRRGRGRVRNGLPTPRETVELITVITRTLAATSPRTTVRRSLQASRALSKTLADLSSYSSSSGGAVASLPAALRILFENLGGTYVKLGQFIASSPTLFPPEYVQEFVKLLDRTEPVPFEKIKAVIQKEVGVSKFEYIDPTPLGSASVSQVHRATYQGKDVVIKVRKPGVEDGLKADLSFLYISSVVLEFVDPNLKKTSLANIVEDIRESMLGELDFVKEGRRLEEFREFLSREGIANVVAPTPVMSLTTEKVLVMDYIDGVSMLDKELIESRAGPSGPMTSEQTIITALNTWTMSVLSMPWFHADVHAGNLLVTRDGDVAFIDFGITGQISPAIFEAVTNLSGALAAGDYRGMAAALAKMGATEDGRATDIDKFGRDIERVLKSLGSVSGTARISPDGEVSVEDVDEQELTAVLLDVVAVTEENGLKLPREFGLLVKQVLYFDRYLKILAPDLDVMSDDRVNLVKEGPGGDAKPIAVEVIRE